MGLHGCSSGVLQRYTFLLLVQSATVGVMDRCLWPRRGARRYAGGVSAARYACSLGYPLPGDVIEFRPPTPPGPVGVEGGGDGGCTQGAWVTNPGPHQVDSAKKGFRSGESALCSSPCSALARRKALPMRSCRWFWTKFAYSCLQSGGGGVLPWLLQGASRCRQPFSCTWHLERQLLPKGRTVLLRAVRVSGHPFPHQTRREWPELYGNGREEHAMPRLQ